MKAFFRSFIFLSFFSVGFICFSQNSSALGLYERGVRKQDSEDFYGASEDFQQALQINPAYGSAWFHLAEVTYSLGDYTLALSYLESAEKYARNRPEILNLRGLIFISLGKLDEARSVFTEVMENYPNDIDSRFGLAELDLFSGSFIGAKNQYEDALKRQGNNRKAILSLALLSAETGDERRAESYIQQALRYHSGDAEVHYLAAYIEARNGNFPEAEKRARSAVQIRPDYTKAYVLLSSVLYSQKRYDDVIDICDYLISKQRNTSEAWYLKGLAQYRKNEYEYAIETWSAALDIFPDDEMMRSALELLVVRRLPVEDSRRSRWSEYHVEKARDYGKMYMGTEARFEYQRALKIDPYNAQARLEFADLLERSGLYENYVNQLEFIQDAEKNRSGDGNASSVGSRAVNDKIEAYRSLMKYSLAQRWSVDPFYLDKTRWHIGIFYTKSPVQLVHCDAEEIAAEMTADIFSGISSTSVVVTNRPVSGYGEAYRLARRQNLDYFILLSVDESEREISLDAVVYSGRTGTETAVLHSFRTGNDRFASVLRSFRRDLLDMLPVRGKIINRSVNEVLVDLGTVEGMKEGVILDVVKAGTVQTADKGPGVVFDEKNLLGTITITRAGEEIAEGTLVQNGFYDRVNVGDEVLVQFRPDTRSDADGQILENAPAAGENGKRILPVDEDEKKRALTAQELGLIKTPAIIELIRELKN